MSDSSAGETRGWWYVVPVRVLPNSARCSFSFRVVPGWAVMELARMRVGPRGRRGDGTGTVGDGLYKPGRAVMRGRLSGLPIEEFR
jgi:hypothetical protein